ncbi:amidohydrolase family protein [Anatilimnocola sp. NA78]|uniref:N-acyl-D-amino-acid deacylase family protein n=1 Tax=Anatilimnocola sp. NA78 TaxID=3415683 RepID=UPI003CE4611D
MSHSACLLVISLLAADPIAADYVLRNGEIYDGGEGAAFVGDVAIKGDRIVAIKSGRLDVRAGTKEIDAAGMIVAPGFIDLHSHSDGPILEPKTRLNANFLTQGCTSVVTGNCGAGPVDVAAYYQKIDEHGAGTNILHLIPHGSLRAEAMGRTNRPPTPAELEKMKELCARGMRDGAWGMATGLIYVPGSFSKTEELVAVAEIVGQHRGIYASHIRNEGSQLLESLDEILAIGKQAKLPVHVSHIKVSGKANWGIAPDAIQKLRDARTAGQQVTADQYPYPASSTSLAAMVIPDELREWKKLKETLDDPEKGDKVRQLIAAQIGDRDGGERLVIANFAPQRAWQGKSLAAIAKETDRAPLEVALEIMSRGGAQVVSFGMNEDEVRLFMREPFVATASDGSAMSLDSAAQPHPRSFGCFSRKIGYYAIEGKVLPLAQAIRSASGLPADILGLPERGYLKEGYFADLLVFDPKTFRDQATFTKPLAWSTGVKLLFVNGQVTVEDGKPTEKLAGRALRHKS